MNALFVLQPGNAELEPRRGDPPLTTRPNREQPFPHQQLTQTAPIELQQELFARVLTLPGLSTGDSCVSVPGARAFILDLAVAAGPAAAFLCETEFAHLHPPGDGSLHIALPPDVYRACKPPVGGPASDQRHHAHLRPPRPARARNRLADRAGLIPLRPWQSPESAPPSAANDTTDVAE